MKNYWLNKKEVPANFELYISDSIKEELKNLWISTSTFSGETQIFNNCVWTTFDAVSTELDEVNKVLDEEANKRRVDWSF